jgi:hypothetical protein
MRLRGLSFLTLLLLSLAVMASAAQAEGVPKPQIPKALQKAEKGHAENMRRNHMNLMIHKRDETVYKGIRTEQYSLKACIACHAVPGPDKQPVSIESPQHFCSTCHEYAAVKVDCFQCHASKPPSSVSLSQSTVNQYGLVAKNDLDSDLSSQIQRFLKR